jgi:phosphoribosyl 1,2-cyclic phosphodiesterase/anti-anti-sigma regulatory factor
VRIKFWGVRGSIPTPLSTEQFNDRMYQALAGAAGVDLADPAAIRAYLAGLPPNVRSVVGGNTTCVEVDTGTHTLIIDCGSGMRALGLSLMAREFGRGRGTAHIFLTHAHWDHLQGYPFFAPAYVPGNRLIFYAVNHNPQTFLEHQQVAPVYFPIPPNAMPADKEYVQLREGETVTLGRTAVSNLSLYHPGTAYAYRFDDGASRFVFASDGEYKSLTDAHLRRYTDFFADADALVFDAQYSLRDVFLSKADWGHSSAIIGVDLAERARAKRLITFHHDPTHSDEQVYAIAAAAREYARVNQITPDTQVLVGTEGLELFLGKPLGLEIVEDRQDELWTVAQAGQLNNTTAAEAQPRLAAALAEAPAGRVLLDLSRLAAVDLLGLHTLLEAPGQPGGTAALIVLAPTLPVRRALEQSGMDQRLPIVRTRQQALAALAGPAHLRLTAATIDGQFQVEDLLFVDEAGVVYRGRDLRTQLPLWVRVVAGPRGDPARRQFVAGVEAWRRVSHPSLLPAQALVETDAWVACATPEPDGLSLREWQARRPAWPEQWRLAGQLCAALAAAHANGLVHGGLLPEHFVMGGAARLACTPLFTPAPEAAFTDYHAPEQLRGQAVTVRTDVYALGLILYELLLGAHPFAAETEALRLTLQLHSQPQSPRLRWPEIPLPLETFLLRLLAADPAERPADGAAVLAEFTALPAVSR